MVHEGGLTPKEVADDMGVSVEHVDEALEYYESNPDVVRKWEHTLQEWKEDMKSRTK